MSLELENWSEGTLDFPGELYLCSLLGHSHQGTELVPDAGQRQLLEQTLLGLSQHEPDQHAEHRWTQVVAGSVCVRLLQLVQRT